MMTLHLGRRTVRVHGRAIHLGGGPRPDCTTCRGGGEVPTYCPEWPSRGPEPMDCRCLPAYRRIPIWPARRTTTPPPF